MFQYIHKSFHEIKTSDTRWCDDWCKNINLSEAVFFCI
jgi:hypothetical protein